MDSSAKAGSDGRIDKAAVLIADEMYIRREEEFMLISSVFDILNMVMVRILWW